MAGATTMLAFELDEKLGPLIIIHLALHCTRHRWVIGGVILILVCHGALANRLAIVSYLIAAIIVVLRVEQAISVVSVIALFRKFVV